LVTLSLECPQSGRERSDRISAIPWGNCQPAAGELRAAIQWRYLGWKADIKKSSVYTSKVQVALALPPSLERTEKEDGNYYRVDSSEYPKALRVL
jgi:hypothetical protein